jgi:hypothetical protein
MHPIAFISKQAPDLVLHMCIIRDFEVQVHNFNFRSQFFYVFHGSAKEFCIYFIDENFFALVSTMFLSFLDTLAASHEGLSFEVSDVTAQLSSINVFCSSILILSQQAHVISLVSLLLLMKIGVSSALPAV